MENIRERYERREREILSDRACLAVDSRGRVRPEEKCPNRTDFQRDRDRILYSKAFRRLKHKTQVFIFPEGDYFRTRMTHSLEVTQIGRSIARALMLNEDLTEAIGLGHDLGHAPFGHAGEAILNELLTKYCGIPFRHNEQSLRVVDVLEDGRGLNLTFETRDGILRHTKGRAGLSEYDAADPSVPATQEGRIIRIADRMAYINHDIEDSIRAGLIREEDLPKEATDVIGHTTSKRINAMVSDVINVSSEMGEITMSRDMYRILNMLKEFMFVRVYTDSAAKSEEVKARRMIESMFEYFRRNPDRLPPEFSREGEPLERGIADYISGMSDSYAIYAYQEIFIPKVWNFGNSR